MTRIVLIRHGQTVWNRERRFRGQADVELDEFGQRQAQATGRYVAARWPVVAVYASPLQRTMRTAEAVARAQGLTAAPLEGLLDINFGEWQGQRGQDVAQRYPELLRAWEQVAAHGPGRAIVRFVVRHRGIVQDFDLVGLGLRWGRFARLQIVEDQIGTACIDACEDDLKLLRSAQQRPLPRG